MSMVTSRPTALLEFRRCDVMRTLQGKRTSTLPRFLGLLIIILLIVGEGLSADEHIGGIHKRSKVVTPPGRDVQAGKGKTVNPLHDQFEVQLRSRRFIPPEDLTSGIASHIRPSRHNRVHVLIPNEPN